MHALPPRGDADAGRLRLRRPGRRPHVRRRGARLPRGPAGRPVRRPGRQAARQAARRDRARRAPTSTSRTSSSAGRPGTATRSRTRSRPASRTSSARSSSCGRSVVATLGNFATKLLSGKPLGITRVHGQEQEVTLGGRRVLLYPLYHPAAALYTPRDAEGARGGLRAAPGAARPHGRAARACRAGAAAVARSQRRRAAPSAARPARALLAPYPVDAWSSRRPRPRRPRRIAARLAAGLAPGDVVTVSGRARRGQDDVRPRRLPRARRRRARDEPDLHDRPPLPRPASTSRTSTSTASSGVSAAEWGDLEPYFDDAVVLRRVARGRRGRPAAGPRRRPFAARRPDP